MRSVASSHVFSQRTRDDGFVYKKKQKLAAREILVSGERKLQSAVSDICPSIDMMWKTKEAYVEVIVRIYRHPLCRWIIVHRNAILGL